MMWRLRVGLFLVVPLVVPSRGAAQNTEDQNHFDFSLPGARSRAIGGAFVAIADDATSVYSNPGGLTQLFRPEISAEIRHWRLTSAAIDRGHGFGNATGIGSDTITGLVEKEYHSDVTGLSFLSFVYPSDRWAVGLFRHQLVRYQMDRQIEGPFFNCSGGYRQDHPPTVPFCEEHARNDGVDREFPKRQSLDLDIHSFGAAFTYDLSDRLSAGVALQYFNFSVNGVNKVFSAQREQKYPPANFTDPGNLYGTSTETGDDHAWAVNAGVLWNISRRWVAGGSYRQGPTFHFLTELVTGPAYEGLPETRVQPNIPFKVPDTYSVGVAHGLTDFWRVSFEYDRTNYHQLIQNVRNTSVPAGPEGDVAAQQLRLNNANQFRLGVERLALMSGGRVFALRGGTWYDPFHQLYVEADASTGLPLPRWAVQFPKGDGAWHASFGAGYTTRRHFQLDVAADLSDQVSTFAVSTVWRF
jgi:long-chain fatty acid transport protein